MRAIHFAAYRGDIVTLRSHLSDGASPDEKTSAGAGVGFAHGCAGKTPLHCVCCFDTDEEISKMLGLMGTSLALRDYAACCRALVAAGADVNAVDADGDSVLHYAAANARTCDELKVMQMLIDAGANVNVRGDDYTGQLPLHWTVAYCNINALGLLLRAGAAVNARAQDGDTILDLVASELSHIDEPRFIPLLLRYGADLPTETDKFVDEPYLQAVIAAGGFEKYANQHLAAITSLFVRTDKPRLPPEMVRHIFSYWLHGGYYLY